VTSAKEPLVTAIVSTYASEKFIRGAMEDLVSQTIFPRTEIIVIDSASPEGEGKVIEEFVLRYPENVFYYRTDRRESLYRAWNRAIRMARGKYLTNANTDDRHGPEAFELLAGALEAHPETAVAYGDYAETNVRNDVLGPHNVGRAIPNVEFRRDHLLVNCFVGSQPMWRRSLHEEFGFFREELRVAADWDFWNRVARRYRFVRVPKATGLMYFSDAADNLARVDPEATLRETENVADVHLRYYWADLVPRVTAVWIREGDRAAWRRSLESIARQSVRPERILIVGEMAEEPLEIWKEFPGTAFGERAFPHGAGAAADAWDGVLSASVGDSVAYLKGTDEWEADHLRRVTDWMGETHFRLVRADGEGAKGPPSISAVAHHACALPAAREFLRERGLVPGATGWFGSMSGRFEGSTVPADAFYPLRGEVSREARERFRDAVCHFHRKGVGAVPRRIDTTARPFLTFLKEYLGRVGRREDDAFTRAAWRGWNNWIRYSLREEAGRRHRERGGGDRP